MTTATKMESLIDFCMKISEKGFSRFLLTYCFILDFLLILQRYFI